MQNTRIATSILQLNTGMYIARLKQVDTLKREMITISPAPMEAEGSIDFFCSSHIKNNTLKEISDCIVMRVDNGKAPLLISGMGGNLASLKIDEITTLNTPSTVQSLSDAPTSNSEKISLEGHIEWKGDVKKEVGEPLGDPRGNKRLEGFIIRWDDKPKDVDIAYSCTVDGMGQSPVVLSGDFSGTRARNLAIQGVIISLVGRGAKKFQMKGSVVFSGMKPQKLISGVEYRGVTGKESLISLQVEILRNH